MANGFQRTLAGFMAAGAALVGTTNAVQAGGPRLTRQGDLAEVALSAEQQRDNTTCVLNAMHANGTLTWTDQLKPRDFTLTALEASDCVDAHSAKHGNQIWLKGIDFRVDGNNEIHPRLHLDETPSTEAAPPMNVKVIRAKVPGVSR